MSTKTFSGPIGVVVFGFPESASIQEGLQCILDRVDAGLIDVLDIEHVSRDEQGAIVSKAISDIPGIDSASVSAFEGACSSILDAEDLQVVVEDLTPGQFAIAIVYEDRSLAQMADRWAHAGGTELLSGGVDMTQLATLVN